MRKDIIKVELNMMIKREEKEANIDNDAESIRDDKRGKTEVGRLNVQEGEERRSEGKRKVDNRIKEDNIREKLNN